MAEKLYDPRDWYWEVKDAASNTVYASKRANYFPDTDPIYLTWKEQEGKATKIKTAFELGEVLAPYLLKPIPADVLAGYNAALRADPTVGTLIDHEERIAALEAALPP